MLNLLKTGLVHGTELSCFLKAFIINQPTEFLLPMNPSNSFESDKPAVILVPGYLESRGCFYTLYHRLITEGYRVFLFDPPSKFNSISQIAESLVKRILSVENTFGFEDLFLIGHSMGGLVCRSGLVKLKSNRSFHKFKGLITLGTPHFGVNIAYLGIGACAVEMRPHSFFLRKLNVSDLALRNKYWSFSAENDLIVPVQSVLDLTDATNFKMKNLGHMSLLEDTETALKILGCLRSSIN